MREIILIGAILIIAVGGYKFVAIPFLKMNKQIIVKSKVEEIMERDGISFEAARDKLLDEKIAKIVDVDRLSYEIEDYKIELGDKISFYNTDEGAYTVGDFVGTKISSAEGYTEHMCIRTNDSKIKIFPVEIIDVETLKIYER